ncbi:ATP-binding protein, partial [Streptomyces sp. NPDC048825]|uniref:ATP-binding protein n=1 Tax=Streptomyces sp. NPDC048825 TaxID=3365592 RepID=UPI00371CF9D5
MDARSLAGRLAAARAGALVGREPERAVLDRMLSGAAQAPFVAYLHGPGGIGKSSLVRYAARQAELVGRRVVHVDARFLDADPRRLEETAAPACTEPGTVLLIDTFEQCQPLETWLRETFLLRLADHAIVVVASRTAPDAEWSLDPGWAQLFTALAREPLLRKVLGDQDTNTVFSWLRQLPYIEATPEGLHPHDAVRATLEAD